MLPRIAEAFDLYDIARRNRPRKDLPLPGLWLSRTGVLTISGLRQMLETRCEVAGHRRVNPRAFGHAIVPPPGVSPR